MQQRGNDFDYSVICPEQFEKTHSDCNIAWNGSSTVLPRIQDRPAQIGIAIREMEAQATEASE
jgi:hypothetical protein